MISSIEKLYEWSKDRPLVTPELHKSNDFYGHAALLKKYAGMPWKYQMKTVIEHAPGSPGATWDVDLKSPLPAMLVCGAHRYPILNEKTNKALFSIGPTIRYVPHFLNNHILSMEKQRIGKTLLVFPHHSSHWVDAHYDIHRHCRILEDIGKEFNTVMVCIYWKDVLRGTSEKYMEHGFECVTAGHMFDPLFLPRLKSIIELATISTSCSYGTQACYCISMGKPHFVIETEVKHIAESDEILRRDLAPVMKPGGEVAVRAIQMKDAFSEIKSDISQKQNEIANRYWGLSEFKTVEEMKLIFHITEDIWKKGLSFLVPSRDVMIEQTVDYINSNDNEKALFSLKQAIAVNSDMPELKYAKAVVLGRLGRMNEARMSLTDLLAVVPNHKKALLLLQEMKIVKANQFQKSDIAIASYPRSGNTWLRVLVSDIILQFHNFKTGTGLPIHEDRVIPDIYDQRLHEIDPRIELPYRLIKTHEQFSSVPGKTIYLFRNAADALCSYFHFHRRYDHLQNKTVEGIDAFCKKRLESWIENVNSYIVAKNKLRREIFFISYEWLHNDPETALLMLAEFLGLQVNKNMITTAIKNHTFNKHHESEKRGGTVGTKYHEYFYRKGKVGSSAQELSGGTLRLIDDKSAPIYQRAASFQLCACSEDLSSFADPAEGLGSVVMSVDEEFRGSLQFDNSTSAIKTSNKAQSIETRPRTRLHSRMLNLGCGGRYHPDWVNVDFHSTGDGVIAHNLNDGIPFDANSFDVVYHSHLLEHLPKNQVQPFLEECFRVLNVGGIIRIAVPDLEQIVKCYLTLLEESNRGDEEAQKEYEWILLELFDQMVRNEPGGEMLKYLKQDPVPAASFALQRMGSEVSSIMGNNQNMKIKHIKRSEAKMVLKPEEIGRFRLSGEIHQWMYDRYSLAESLRQVGFGDVKSCCADESQIPKFASYFLDIEPNGSIRKPDSLFMEGLKC